MAAGSSAPSALVRDPVHGPLPALLLVMTAVTGVVDAVSILGLGRVFVANMTGNVVFLGFAVARAPGFELGPSLAALVAFLVGAFAAGHLVDRFADHRGTMLRNGLAIEAALLAVAVVMAIRSVELTETMQIVIAVPCAAAMGIQNSVARRLAVPDLTTTVLTLTLTGLAADVRRMPRATVIRRLLAVVTLFAGAGIGALVVIHTRLVWGLALALGLVVSVTAAAARVSRSDATWHRPAAH